MVSHGVLDSSFYGTGFITRTPTFPAPYVAANAQAVTVTADGYILAYNALDTSLFESDMGVMKVLADGTIDSAFGSGGVALVSVVTGFANESSNSHFVLPDGKILLTGHEAAAAHLYGRLNSNGTLDSSFDGDGLFRFAVGPGSSMYHAPGSAIDTLGRALLVGNISSDSLITRIAANGGADNTFSGDGTMTHDISGSGDTDQFERLVLQSDGKIIAVGNAGTGASTNASVARYLTDGTPDPGFASAGVLTFDVDSNFDALTGVALQTDGKILAVGRRVSSSGTDSDFLIIRLTTSGAFDSTYSGDGKAVVDFGFTNETGAVIVLYSDGRALVGGGAGGEHTLFLLKTDGAIDSSFGDGGIRRTSQVSTVRALSLSSDGKILSSGIAAGVPYLFRFLP